MDWFNERQDLKVRDAVRKQLAGQYFRKIELWRLFGANLTLAVWENCNSSKGRFNFIADFAFFIYLLFFKDIIKWRSRKRIQIKSSYVKKTVAIEAISDEKRIRDLWLPVADKLEKVEAILVTPKKVIYEKYKNKFDIYFLDKFSVFDWLLSRVEVLKFIFKNFKFLFKSNIKSPLSGYEIINTFIGQLDYFIRFKYFIKKLQPSCFVTIWDWYDFGIAGTLAFKSHKLPTFTFIHGAANKEALKEFVPLNADYIFSWGKINTKALIELGIERNAILEVGCPRMRPFKSQMLAPRDGSLSRMLIILSVDFDTHFVDDILNIVNLYSKTYVITIRLHPSTSLDDLPIIIRKLSVHYVTNQEQSLKETILKADLIITNTTSAAFDVVFFDKALFVIDSSPKPLLQDIVNEIVTYGAAVFCRSFEDLVENINQFALNPNIDINHSFGRKKFVEDFLCLTADESANKICTQIRSILSS